ncbi:oxysterol-binding protein-related protein 3 isoform X4 [Mucor ambiguus]|uniref:NAD(+) diphosphatase n=1 Tax=Mucor ambiguus TaxID=91626 RepID=A0A0C9N541_9FUNG|nr:oxysterol-binding protein-related protein 3 isoform X4 [Mucor ambiguus]
MRIIIVRFGWNRDKPEFLARLARSPKAKYIILNRLKALYDSDGNLHYVGYDQVASVVDRVYTESEFVPDNTDVILVFMGIDESQGQGEDGEFIWALDLTPEGTNEEEYSKLVKGFEAQDLEFSPTLPRAFVMEKSVSAIIAQAAAMVDWNARTKFCSACGKRTTSQEAGYKRNCPTLQEKGPKCMSHTGIQNFAYPRTDAVVIVCIIHPNGDKILLGRQKRWPNKMFSCVSGFVEAAETLEEAVRREAFEETGVIVDRVAYHSSQPWPFPNSLMLGFIAEAVSTDIHFRDDELEAAEWFTRSEVIAAVKGEKSSTFSMAPKGSLASTLVHAWINDKKWQQPTPTTNAKILASSFPFTLLSVPNKISQMSYQPPPPSYGAPPPTGQRPPQQQYQQQGYQQQGYGQQEQAQQGYGAPPPPAGPPPGVDQQLYSWFKAVDTDGSGQLSADELQKALINGDWSPFNIETVRLMVNMFDTDNSGTINFNEFAGLWKYIEDWKRCFQAFDADRSGSINQAEMGNALRSFGFNVSPKFISTLIQKFDRYATIKNTGKGDVSFDNFVQACVTMKTLTDSFRQFDTDGDGWVQINYEQASFMQRVWDAFQQGQISLTDLMCHVRIEAIIRLAACDMEVVQVQPRDSYLHNIYVPTKGTVIRWSFTTKKNNIAFGLFRRKEKEPLPNSSEIVFRAQQQLQKRQMSFPSDLGANRNNSQESTSTVGDEDIESNYLHSSNQSIHSQNNSSHHSNRPRSKSVATIKLKDSGMDEIIPIQHAQSSDQKVEGAFVVDEPGNYVLVFDNTFSRNTPKKLTYSVALGNPEDVKVHVNEVSGWLLKKKRKRMQGWAKRWFTLSPTGVLSYSTSQNSVTRGSIQILVSTISYNPNLRQINIDSGTMLYHLKTLTEADYDLWQSALTDTRRKNGEYDDSPIPQDENNKSSISVAASKRHSSRYGENKKIRAEIEQGLETSSLHQQNTLFLAKIIEELEQVLINNDLQSIQPLMEKLDHQKLQMVADANEQISQWKNVQNYFASSGLRRSGSISPIISNAQQTPGDDTIHEDYEHLHRSSSVYSRMSGYSDQFFDAEDIVLSGGEDEDDIIEAGSSIDDESSDEDSEPGSGTEVLDLTSMSDCARRTKLPSPAVADAGSALSVFRKNVGKDLSTIAMPISMNEPLNMLQKACEELEYCELLEKASTLTDAMERLMYVTAFSISSYASSQYRTGRKPFNPMMTETYENIRPDKGFRFISEKVSHNPLVIAAHAEAKGFKYWQSTQIKSKFWGKSMEFMTEGTFHVTLTGHDDHYTFFKPSSWMKNMIAGEKYLEHSGECKVVNKTTGDYAVITFKEGSGGGLFGAPTKRNDVIATLYDANDTKVRRVVGKWSESLAEEVGLDKKKLSVIWNARPPGIKDHDKYFGFTKFATELNELTELERDKLPITDTRLRPDQQLYEKGNVDEADEEKLRIEQQQRDKRKEFELQGKEWLPRWFSREGEEWLYSGQYWPTRETGQWPKDQFPLW